MTEPKRIYDHFLKWGGNEWYIYPSIVFYKNPNQFWSTGETSPAWGVYFMFLKLTIGFQSQKNLYYK